MVFDLFSAPRPRRPRIAGDVKQDLYRRQGGQCMYCGARQRMDLMDVDHKRPLSRGGSNGRRNLQLLCRTCNARKGNKTDREFRMAYRDAGVSQNTTIPGRAVRQSVFTAAGKRAQITRRRERRASRVRDPLQDWRWP